MIVLYAFIGFNLRVCTVAFVGHVQGAIKKKKVIITAFSFVAYDINITNIFFFAFLYQR